MSHCRVFIVDPHPISVLGLQAALSSDPRISILGSASERDQAIREIQAARPDVILCDDRLRPGTVYTLVAEIRRLLPLCKVVVLSAFDENLAGRWAIRCGAAGLLSKSAPAEVIRDSVLRAWNGSLIYDAAVLGPDSEARIDRISSREYEVFFLMGQGRSSKEIASELDLSPRTVETYQRALKEKLNVPHFNALLRLATLVFAVDLDESRSSWSDTRLLARFESRSLRIEEWDHRTHLRVAFCYLSRLPFSRALRAIQTGIQALNDSHGNEDGYHETITVAYARILRARIQNDPYQLTSERFLDDHSQFWSQEPLAPLMDHYSRPCLLSPKARARFVPPDRAPLPEVAEHL